MRAKRMRVLLVVLVVAALVGRPEAAEVKDSEQMAAFSPRSLKFTPIPDMPDCASAAILRGDPRSGPAWVYLKLASGCRVPWHWHTANETMVVISGRGSLSMKDGPLLKIEPGAYASLPSRHVHQASCSRTCLFFNGADAAFDINYVDASGETISLEKAMSLPPPKAKKKKR